MRNRCYVVEANSCIESLFDELDDYGFDYIIEDNGPGFIEVTVPCTDAEVRDLEAIFAPYV